MNWLNIGVSIVRDPEFVDASHLQIATWFKLLVYCTENENRGTIRFCRSWSYDKWLRIVGVLPDDVLNHSGPLYTWEGDDLLVLGYNSRHERSVILKRRAAIHTNQQRWSAKCKDAPEENYRSASHSASRSASRKERKKVSKYGTNTTNGSHSGSGDAPETEQH